MSTLKETAVQQWPGFNIDGLTHIPELAGQNSAWIRSSWLVRTPLGISNCDTSCLSNALAKGIRVAIDPKRAGFFEVVVRDRWLYFHVADNLQCIYLVAAATLSADFGNTND